MGRDITELQRARRHLPMAEPVLRPVLDGLARYFRDRSSWRGGQKTPEFLAQIDARWPAWRARRRRPRATARWWRWWASAAPSSPTLPSTNPPIPTWRATHHDRRIQSLRHLLPLAAGAGRGHAGRGLGPCAGCWPAGLYRLVWHPALFDLALFVVLLYGVTLISPIFSRDSHEDPQRPAPRRHRQVRADGRRRGRRRRAGWQLWVHYEIEP